MPELHFHRLRTAFSDDDFPETKVYRARVPGGWLVMARTSTNKPALTFVPDVEHRWDGGSTSF